LTAGASLESTRVVTSCTGTARTALGRGIGPAYIDRMFDRDQKDSSAAPRVPVPEAFEDSQSARGTRETPRELFSRMDAELIRVIEDLAFALIEKGLLTLRDLPPHAQNKLLDRRGFRDRFHTYRAQHHHTDFVDVLDDSNFGQLR
jgi:hypothetical protein